VDDPLKRVRQATRRREASEEAWRRAIREAVAAGESLRRVADAAGVSHVRVLQLVREDEVAGQREDAPGPATRQGGRDAEGT
jgi:hypothetical protein